MPKGISFKCWVPRPSNSDEKLEFLGSRMPKVQNSVELVVLVMCSLSYENTEANCLSVQDTDGTIKWEFVIPPKIITGEEAAGSPVRLHSHPTNLRNAVFSDDGLKYVQLA